MLNEFDKKIMLKFLETNYPVSRVKLDLRFKRAIVLDSGGAFILSNPIHVNHLKFQLVLVLHKVFNCEESISRAVLDNFLRLT